MVGENAPHSIGTGRSLTRSPASKLKMDVLKSHLKGYVADDYEYDIDVTLWERFKKAATKKRDVAKKAAS